LGKGESVLFSPKKKGKPGHEKKGSGERGGKKGGKKKEAGVWKGLEERKEGPKFCGGKRDEKREQKKRRK